MNVQQATDYYNDVLKEFEELAPNEQDCHLEKLEVARVFMEHGKATVLFWEKVRSFTEDGVCHKGCDLHAMYGLCFMHAEDKWCYRSTCVPLHGCAGCVNGGYGLRTVRLARDHNSGLVLAYIPASNPDGISMEAAMGTAGDWYFFEALRMCGQCHNKLFLLSHRWNKRVTRTRRSFLALLLLPDLADIVYEYLFAAIISCGQCQRDDHGQRARRPF